jgi:hypothetical protein
MSERSEELAARKALLVARSTLYRIRLQLEAGQLRRSVATPQAVLGKLAGAMRYFTLVKACVAVVAWAIAVRRRGS